METGIAPGSWKAIFANGSWKVQDGNGQIIATINKGENDEAYAHLIAASPYMLEALKGLVGLIGDEDLSDNGELSGAAICDLVRSALALAINDETYPSVH